MGGGDPVEAAAVSLLHRVLTSPANSFWVISAAGVTAGGAAVVAAEAG